MCKDDGVVYLNEPAARELYDELVPVSGEEAVAMSQRLAAEEGIFTGISSGATLAAALSVARKAPEGAVILAMLPDEPESTRW